MGKRGILEERTQAQTSCPPAEEQASAILKNFSETTDNIGEDGYQQPYRDLRERQGNGIAK